MTEDSSHRTAAPATPPGTMAVSVILAVRSRDDLLRRCMECLSAQEAGLDGVEVWVVDDGSLNGEAMCRAALEPLASTRARAHFEPRDKLGPAAQRNWAIRHSRAQILLFLNDDVEFGPDFLRWHLESHADRPGHCVVGNTRWHPACVRTPFMHWVAHNDSFYYLIRDHADIGWEYVHTLNCSVHRRWFEEDPEGFCEQFPDPSFEDTEWGLRMTKKGMKVSFAHRAVAYHRHEFGPAAYWSKTIEKGRSARLLIARHPEVRERILGPHRGWLGKRIELWQALHAARREGMEGPRLWNWRMISAFQHQAAR